MENMLLSLNVILPLFVLLALGYGIRCTHMVKQEALDALNTLVFKLLLPVMLFQNIYTTDLAAFGDWKLLCYAVGSLLAVYLLLMVLVPRFVKTPARRGVMVQGIFRSNFVIFSLPVTAALFGENNVGVTAMLVAVITPLFNVLAVICLEGFRGGRVKLSAIVRNILTNPLVIAAALGFAVLLLRIPLPTFAKSALSSLSKAATPMGLLLLGSSFRFSAVRQNRTALFWGVLCKLVLVAAVVVPVGALWLGFRQEALAALLLLYAAPCAVSSYNMARQMGGDAQLAAHLVVFSSTCSVISMFLWIFVLRTLHWL